MWPPPTPPTNPTSSASIHGVAGSVVVHLDDDRDVLMALVLPSDGRSLDDLRPIITRRLAEDLSPRHGPDAVVGVHALPRTLTGRRLEVPVERLLTRTPVAQAVEPSTVDDPAALEELAALGPSQRRGPR